MDKNVLIFNKLVRDKIPEIIESNNEVAIYRILESNEYRQELYKKLLEEANEVINSKNSNDLIVELADVLEVLRAFAELENKELCDIIDLANQKKLKRGGFSKRVFLEKTYNKD